MERVKGKLNKSGCGLGGSRSKLVRGGGCNDKGIIFGIKKKT